MRAPHRDTGARPRISGGEARGRVLPNAVPAGVRPTASRVREALFSIVGQDLDGLTVLDAFGGSGLLGLEAWSRGARVVIVERAPATADVIRANARALGASDGPRAIEVRVADVMSLARASGLGRFDAALVDPPYSDAPQPIVDLIGPNVTAWMVLETEARTEAPRAPARLVAERARVYGSTALVVYRAAAG